MKVLYLDHPEADFLSALVFRGLCEELGPENVVDWAWQPHFHGQVYNGPVPYGPGAVGSCGPYPWMPAFPGRPWTDTEVFSRIKDFNLVILASPRTYNTQRARDLVKRFGRSALPRFVMLDGEDYTTVRWDIAEELKPDVYFKTSLVSHPVDVYPEQRRRIEKSLRVAPCPLVSSFNTPAVAQEKTIDVCFLGGSNWYGTRREGIAENRPKAKPILEEHLQRELPTSNLVLGQVPYAEYRATLAASKIAICVSGHGLEGLRTYEAMSCPDTFVIRETLPQITPWPLLDGDTCGTFTAHEQIPMLCKKWLENEGRLAVARRGNNLVQNHYTTRARARYILAEAFR